MYIRPEDEEGPRSTGFDCEEGNVVSNSGLSVRNRSWSGARILVASVESKAVSIPASEQYFCL